MPLTETDCRKIVEEATNLPSLPTVISAINEKINSPTTSASEVAGLIQEDQALTSNILKLVNSALYGFPRQVNSITRAIVILGFNRVRNLALATTVIEAFKGQTSAFDFIGFWKHSLTTAIACDIIAKHFRIHEVEDAFVSGLLHDIGKLVISVCFQEELVKISEIALETPRWIRDAEEEILGVDHTQVGFWLVQKWGLSDEISNSIRFHHQPLNSQNNASLVQSVHLADIIARSLSVGSGGDELVPEIDKTVWDKMELDELVLESFFEETVNDLQKAKAFFKMISEKPA